MQFISACCFAPMEMDHDCGWCCKQCYEPCAQYPVPPPGFEHVELTGDPELDGPEPDSIDAHGGRVT